MMNSEAENEIQALRVQLAEHYDEIAKMFKRMGKTIDNHTWKVLDSGVASRIEVANQVRQKIRDKQKQFFADWEMHKAANPNQPIQ